uniref:Uncharacterized protein AlNc14C35G3151 n=1 Tax=Albugo laibachii Nc14 TaxID=890382 RepID=F0W8M6_9STRA|nr:conserved hypothetical protein [Albugo laibachii Nc14]|eukprot:CCA17482.1 conserved hypothetical protein [Albugo laibachii Nc14]
MRLQCDETAFDVLLRSIDYGFRTNVPFLDEPINASDVSTVGDATESGYKPRQVTQILAEYPFPTALLFHIVAAFLLKNVHEDEYSAQQVYMFDHEYELHAEILRDILLQTVETQLFDSDRATIVEALMDQVIVYRCHSTYEWIATINSLHFDLLTKPNTPILLILHRINSFDDIDKMMTQRFGNGLALTEKLYMLLRDFIQHHTPTVIASTEVTFRKNSWDSLESSLPAWTSQVHRRILFRRDPSKQGLWYTSKCMAQRRSASYHFEISDRHMIVNIQNANVSLSATSKRLSTDSTVYNRS